MTTTAMTYELPADHPIRKLESRRAEVQQERANLNQAVREARELLQPGNPGPTPPDEKQAMMRIRMASARDIASGTNNAERLRLELDQARADHAKALEEFTRKKDEARDLVGMNGGAGMLEVAINRELSDLGVLIKQARADIVSPLLPEAEERYRQAAKGFMDAFMLLAALKSTIPGTARIEAPDLPKMDALDGDVVPDYQAAGRSHAPGKHRQFGEDVSKLMHQLVPMAFHGVLPNELRYPSEPNPRHDPHNPHSPSHDYDVEVIPPEEAAA